jgi:hypothetical protein
MIKIYSFFTSLSVRFAGAKFAGAKFAGALYIYQSGLKIA